MPPSEKILQSRYHIQGLIESNLIFNLYLAKDLHFSGKLWLIKEINISSQDSFTKSVLCKQFNERSQYLSRLEHPYLPKIVDYFIENGLNYVVMEYKSGQILKNILKNTKHYSEKQALEIITQLADVIEYLHSLRPKPILLLNINPSHIYIHSSGILLIEYGFAPIIAQSGKVDLLLDSSEGYCAPEMLQAKISADNRTDIYSLGVILYQLLTAIDPKNSSTFSSIRIKNPSVSFELDNLVKRVIKVNPSERVPSISHFKKELIRIPRITKEEQKFNVNQHAVSDRFEFIERKSSSDGIGSKTEALRQKTTPHVFKTKKLVFKDDIYNDEYGDYEDKELSFKGNLKIKKTKSKNIFKFILSSIAVVFIIILLSGIGFKIIWGRNNYDYQSMGIKEYNNGNYSKSIEYLTKAQTIAPSDALVSIYIQNSYLSMSGKIVPVIAVSVPLTGYIQHNGDDLLRGIALAQMKANKSDILNGIKIILEDDSSTIAGAIEAANRICKHKEVLAVIGNITSDQAKSTAPIYNSNKIIALSPTAICSNIADLGAYIFRMCGKNDIQTNIAAEFCIKKAGFSKIGIIYDQTQDYSVNMAKNFKEKTIELGGNIIIEKSFSNSSDITGQISDIIQSSPELLFFSGYYKDGATLAINLREKGSHIQILGGDSLYIQDLIDIGGKSVEGILFTSFYYSDYNDTTKEFSKEFSDTFHVLPSARSALAYDSTMFLLKAIYEGKSDRKLIKDYLLKEGFSGITGKTSFDKHGNSSREIFLLTVKDRKFILGMY